MVAMTTMTSRYAREKTTGGFEREIFPVNGGSSLPRWNCSKAFAITVSENWKLIRRTSMTLLPVRKLNHRHNKCSRHDFWWYRQNQMISSGRLKPTTTHNATAFKFWIDCSQTSVLLRCDVFEKTFERCLMRILMNRISGIVSTQLKFVESELALQWLAFAAFSHFSLRN